MSEPLLRFGADDLASTLGARIREGRELVGWTQAELAERAETSQSVVSRLESGNAPVLDLAVLARVLAALGMGGGLQLTGRHLDDRRRQRDPVHARLVGMVAARLRAAGWSVETEVPIGPDPPRGWIDLLGYREHDGAGILGEVKADLPDIGALQRQVHFYQATAARAGVSLGWRIEYLHTTLVALDSRTMHSRIQANRDLLRQEFPGSPSALLDWIEDEGAPLPVRGTLVLADPVTRRRRWGRSAFPPGRRPSPAYEDYADAARRLTTRRRRPRGPPGRRTRSPRSPPR